MSRFSLCISALFLVVSACATSSDVTEEPLSAVYGEGMSNWQRQRQDRRSAGWVFPALKEPPVADLPYRVILDRERPLPGSRSVGTASSGQLLNSSAMPLEGEHVFILPSHHFREANFATGELADLLEAASIAVESEFPGSRLALGDASLARGGNINYHASHESGRDVDMPFFMKRNGDRIETAAFVRFRADGSNGALHFDVERNWALVRALLTLSDDTVQWIFVSRSLAQLLVEHGEEAGEPSELIERARAVLWQPSDSSPHDDHFHVRIYCSPRDRLEGCVNYGPEWDWANHSGDLHGARVEELLRALDDPNIETRVDAVNFITRIEGASAAVPLAHTAADQPPSVQLTILRALRRFRPVGVDREIVALASTSSDEEVQLAALEVAATYPLPAAADMLIEITGVGEPLAPAAARGLLLIEDPSLVPDLLDAIGAADPSTRIVLAQALTRITGFTADIDWGAGSGADIADGVAVWRQWLEENEGALAPHRE